jgi:hypothetical protein
MKLFTLFLFPLFLAGCAHVSVKEEANQSEPLSPPPTETMERADALPIAPVKTPASFSGTWVTEADGISFFLDISETDGTISGYHCGITENARRIDCCEEIDGLGPSVEGVVTNEGPIGEIRQTARLNVRSCYIDAEVVAFVTLKKDGESLQWTLIDDSMTEHYIPKEALMTRKQ